MLIGFIIFAIIAILFILNDLVKKTNWYKNQIPDCNNYPRNAFHEYDVVNIGSSSAMYAFDYTDTGLKGLNWAMQPQSMEYSFKVLKEYVHVLKPGATVIIPFAPFSGLSVDGKWPIRNFEKYTYILQKEKFSKNIKNRRKYPLLTYRLGALKKLLRDEKTLNVSTCRSYQCHTQAEFERDAANWIKCWKDEFRIDNLDAPMSEGNVKGRKVRMEVFREIMQFCMDRNLKPIVVMPPVHSSLAKYFTHSFRNNYIDSFIKETLHESIPYLDYMDDRLFADKIYYSNSFFLNKRGRKLFTCKVLQDVGLT